jgi:shikimate kinase
MFETLKPFAAEGFNTKGIEDFLRNNVVNLLILFVAAGMLLLANKGEYRQAMTRVGIVLAGIFVLGLAISGKADDLGGWLVGLVTG